MKRNQVEVGKLYIVKVSGQLTTVRIDRENPRGGWDATNLSTRKKIHIKTAARLRGEASSTDGTESQTTLRRPQSRIQAVVEEALQQAKNKDCDHGEANGKTMSLLDAAARVLQEAGRPMTAKAIIELVESRGYWKSPGGKTPDRTLYAAIIRELAAKGEASRFRKTERGQFAHA